jgi:hypothetical protein
MKGGPTAHRDRWQQKGYVTAITFNAGCGRYDSAIEISWQRIAEWDDSREHALFWP